MYIWVKLRNLFTGKNMNFQQHKSPENKGLENESMTPKIYLSPFIKSRTEMAQQNPGEQKVLGS